MATESIPKADQVLLFRTQEAARDLLLELEPDRIVNQEKIVGIDGVLERIDAVHRKFIQLREHLWHSSLRGILKQTPTEDTVAFYNRFAWQYSCFREVLEREIGIDDESRAEDIAGRLALTQAQCYGNFMEIMAAGTIIQKQQRM